MPSAETILSRFDTMAKAHPDRVGVEGASVSLTYRELDAAARVIANQLTQAGVGPGDFVPLLMGRSPAFLAAVLGVLRLGAAYAPIDPESPAPRRRAMLEPLHAKACLVDETAKAPDGLVAICAANFLAADEELDEVPPQPDGYLQPDSPAYVMYTSGSTGTPKGVVVPHRAVVRLVVDADYAEFSPELRWGLLSAVAFDASTLEIWGALLNGGCCVVQEAAYPSLDDLARFLKQRQLDSVFLTTTLFNALVDVDADSMSSLTQVFTGGELESVRHMRALKRACPQVRLIHPYGPTENTTFSLCRTVTDSDLQDDRVPIGRSIRGSTERIVEPGRFDQADERERGELLVGGEGLALGYLGRKDLTDERFVTDSDGVRWYRTGDLVRRLTDGSVLFLGRLDRQVKIRGHRIEPDEVEAALNSCPGVRQAAVLVRGETAEDRHLVGVFVPDGGATEADVMEFLKSRLPRPMIPSKLLTAAELPRGSTQKVDRQSLALSALDTGEHERPNDLCGTCPPARLGTITDRFDDICARFFRDTAVEGEDLTLTYAQLSCASWRLARRLTDAGVRPGDIVPILLGRTPAFVASVLAALRCDAAYAPIDPNWPRPRIESLLADLRSPLCIAEDHAVLPSGVALLSPDSSIDQALRTTECSVSSVAPGAISPESAAYVMFTSGSTGRPKGVRVPHRGVCRLVVDADYADFRPHQRWGAISSLCFDLSTLEIWGALLNGGVCVLQERSSPSLSDLARFLTSRRIHSTWLTASLFNAMTEDQSECLAHLTQVFTGGERESMKHIRAAYARCPHTTIIHGYGPTECTTFTHCHTVTERDLSAERLPIGKPIRGTTERIVAPSADPDEPVPTIDSGELLVGGAGLALDYLGLESLTREKFVTDNAGVRWYRTGDLVRRLADGSIEFLGRLDRQVKIRGHRIEPDEVEAALNSCPGVRQAAVLVRGETAEDRHLVGVFVPENGATETDVRACLEARLPRPMIPGRLVAVSALPRGSTDKVDRRALEQQLDGLHTADANAKPRGLTETETTLVDLINRRLKSPGPIGRETGFASIGGHSLAAMRLCADIHLAFGVSPTPIEILTLQTVSQIASRVDELAQRTAAAATTDANQQPREEVGDIRRRVLLESERDPTGRAMLVHQAWVASPGIEADTLRSAWSRLIDRHEALSTGFVFDADGVQRVSHASASSEWFHEEGSLPTDSSSVENALPQAALDAIARRIEASAIPVRVHAWRLTDGASLIVAAYHHGAVDEWSLELIESELGQLLQDREPDPAPGYGAFVALERLWLDEPAADEIAGRIAATSPPPGPLPDSGPQEGIERTIDSRGLGPHIDAAADAEGVSPAALMLGVFGRVLQSRYGDPGRWVMTPVSKRVRPELQRLVGCCLDMRIIDASQAPAGVQSQIRAAQGESVLPIEHVIRRIRELNPIAVGHATRFGFTYRVIDDAELHVGGRTLKPIAVPQPAARFGVALHVERRSSGTRLWLEASSSSVDREDLEAIASGVVEAFQGKSPRASSSHAAIASKPTQPETSVLTERPSHLHAERTAVVLTGLWTDLLGSAPDPDRDFYASGGSSLKAMQLGAMVHDRTGLKLHVGEFLREPTFEGLLRWVREDPERPYALFKRSGPCDEHGVMLAIPGSSGRAVDLHAFWSAYSEHERGIERMIGCDLVTIANELAPDADAETIRRAFIDRAVHAAIDESDGRPVRIMGYSLGGVIAFGVASVLLKRGVPVQEIILLDAYAPAYLIRSRQTIAAKLNARIRRGLRPAPAKRRTTETGEKAEAPKRELWRKIHHAFASWTPPRLNVPAVLVQSSTARQHLRPILHAKSNGLKPYLRGPFRTVSVEVDHLKMLTTGAVIAAEAAAKQSSASDGQPR